MKRKNTSKQSKKLSLGTANLRELKDTQLTKSVGGAAAADGLSRDRDMIPC
ncbi:hypothetical protein Hoch_1876 [Haliangium ochraceum DSM 14365]|uniref:Uncharacterized protein n=2 Tax=Haliangium ochraceum TaxID=80816 RepID=D0LYV4_HALO1|nr:hypothetical protein Hoch_1876 [Haliangium ochraceum DSM 14365]